MEAIWGCCCLRRIEVLTNFASRPFDLPNRKKQQEIILFCLKCKKWQWKLLLKSDPIKNAVHTNFRMKFHAVILLKSEVASDRLRFSPKGHSFNSKRLITWVAIPWWPEAALVIQLCEGCCKVGKWLFSCLNPHPELHVTWQTVPSGDSFAWGYTHDHD